MRRSVAAFVLTLVTIIVYYQSSGGQLYPSFETVSQNSFGLNQPLGLLFHLFYHLGIKHFVGNIIPLFVFAFILGLVVPWWEVTLLFLAAGILSAVVFSLLNPSSFLVGASSGVSALMTSAALLRPKIGVALLVAVPLLTFGVVFPLLDQTAAAEFKNLETHKTALDQKAADLEKQNRVEEAAKVRVEANLAALTLARQHAGRELEEEAQTDFIVHLIGALLGAVFVLAWHAKELEVGLLELAPLFDRVQAFFRGS